MTTRALSISITLGMFSIAGCTAEEDGGVFTLRGAGDLSAVDAQSVAPRANTGLSPETFDVKVYGFSVSPNADCSDPITVLDEPDPPLTDMMENPTIWEGEVPDGSYPCVIMEISDNLHMAPAEDSDDGICIKGEVSVRDVCHGNDDNGFQRIDGTTGACTDEEQRVALFISTWATSEPTDGTNPFWAPTEDDDVLHGLHLDGELVVEGDTVGTFVVDATGQVQSSSDECELLPPTFAFL